MKTPEEIAIRHGLYHSYTKKADGLAVQAMKEFALEACKEVLKNASENARMKVHDGHFKSDSLSEHIQIGANNIQIDKESILSENNIPKQIKL